MPEQYETTNEVTQAERAVLDKLLTYAVTMRDTAAKLDDDNQWQRYTSVTTVVTEIIENGWDD